MSVIKTGAPPVVIVDADGNVVTFSSNTNVGWESESIAGRTRDPAKDLVFTYGDGTNETLYFTSGDDYAGKSKRE